MAPGPSDRCPYARPFPPGFDACPTYMVTLFSPSTSREEPLEMERSCRFLTSATAEAGRFYPRCELGTAADRTAIVTRLDSERLNAIRRLRAELSVALGPAIAELGRLRSRRRSARLAHHGEADEETTEKIEAAGQQMVNEIRQFFERRAQELESLGIPVTAADELLQELRPVLTAYEDRAEFRISNEVLGRFPPEAQLFLRPSAAAASVRSTGGRSDRRSLPGS